jgi:NADH-quinone oxidoreductase subunit F
MPTSPDFKPTPVLTKRIPEDRAQRKTVWFDQYVATGGYKTLERVLSMQPGEITDQVKAAILRGRGGAGFPAGLKWSFLTPPDGGPRYLAINCDEAEPGTFKDRLLVDFDPHAVLEGIAIAAYACQMQTAYFFIRGEYHHQAKVFQKALEEAYANGVFGKQGLMRGASKFAVDVVLHRSAGAYICGEETALLEAIEGKRGWPRVKPPFPAIKGLFGRPTIINNVETLAAVVPIMEHGVDWWKKMGVESTLPGGMPSYGTKLMGVSGHVNKPNTYELELGIPLRMLVENHCGGMRNGKKFKGAIAGGVSMGVLGTDQYDAPMDFDIGRKYDVLGLGTACPTIFDEDTDMVAVARNICRFFKSESCGQCTPCREGSGWLLKLITRIERGAGTTQDLDMLLEIAGSNKFRPEFERRVTPRFVPVYVSAAGR